MFGAFPLTGGTTGAPLIGGFRLMAAHLFGAVGSGFGDPLADGEAEGVGVDPGMSVDLLLDPFPVNTVKVRISRMAITIAVPVEAPMIVLRRFARARRSSSA